MSDIAQAQAGTTEDAGRVLGSTPAQAAAVPTGPNTPMPFHSASLYVGDLHPDVTEALLFDIFNAVGPVASIRVCRDAITRRSLGYAYVNFHNLTDAERALDTMNYTLIKDRPCRMMWSQRDPSLRKNGAGNVFVKNLDLSIDNKALYDTFSLFGNILSCKVVTDRNGKSRGYGFVHFETVEAANEAIRKINGMLIAGKEVFVGNFLKRNERPSATEWTNVYVKNIPRAWSKDTLEEVFVECGPIASAVIMTDSEGVSKGFGFVDFVEHSGAVEAIEKLNSYEVDLTEEKKEEEERQKAKKAQGGETEEDGNDDGDEQKEGIEVNADGKTYLVVCRAQKKTERERELSQKFEQLKLERMNKYQGVNLYVKNLDDRVDDEMLRKEFSQFGSITSARVMREKEGEDKTKPKGASKGFGFVCFSSAEEAIRAVTDMNGRLMCGKPIYVALAQRKETRRAQLEAQHQQRGMPMQPPLYPMPQHPLFPRYLPQQMMAPRGIMQAPRGIPQQMMAARGYPGPIPQQIPGVAPVAPQQQPQQQPQQAGTNGRPAGNNGSRRGGAGGQRGGRVAAGNVQFSQNARNTNAVAQPGQQTAQPQAGAPTSPTTSQAPLTAAALASASPTEQKNMIGEKLYPLVQALQPNLAGKITGMLLEMDNPELLHLLESPDALRSKVNEAIQVLQKHNQM